VLSRTLLVIVVAAALSGCTSMPLTPLQRPSMEGSGEVVIYRESAFVAGGISLTVGANANAFAYLSNGEQVLVSLPTGDQEIFVRAKTSNPTRVRIVVKRGERICLRTSSNPNTIAKVIVPIVLMITGYDFYLDVVPCMPPDELAKYKLVPVTYQ
jgi:hypothetical protein